MVLWTLGVKTRKKKTNKRMFLSQWQLYEQSYCAHTFICSHWKLPTVSSSFDDPHWDKYKVKCEAAHKNISSISSPLCILTCRKCDGRISQEKRHQRHPNVKSVFLINHQSKYFVFTKWSTLFLLASHLGLVHFKEQEYLTWQHCTAYLILWDRQRKDSTL